MIRVFERGDAEIQTWMTEHTRSRMFSHQFHSLELTDSDVHQYNNYRGLMSTFLLSIASCAINKFSVTAQSIRA